MSYTRHRRTRTHALLLQAVPPLPRCRSHYNTTRRPRTSHRAGGPSCARVWPSCRPITAHEDTCAYTAAGPRPQRTAALVGRATAEWYGLLEPIVVHGCGGLQLVAAIPAAWRGVPCSVCRRYARGARRNAGGACNRVWRRRRLQLLCGAAPTKRHARESQVERPLPGLRYLGAPHKSRCPPAAGAKYVARSS